MATTDHRPRVLIIVQNLPVPFDRRVWLEATTLTRAGYVVSVICPKARGFTRGFEVLDGVHIHRYSLPFDAAGTLGFVAEFLWCFLRTVGMTLRVALRGRGFDVLHICNPPETYWPLAMVCRALGKRFVFDHHDLSPEMYRVKFGGGSTLADAGLRFLERMTFRAADIVITTNESHRRVARERGGVAEDGVHVVRSGPDLARFSVHPPEPAWRRGKQYLLVYLGEICSQDGVEHLIRALLALRQEFGRDDVHCVLVGGGPHQPAVRAYADSLGVADLCTFTGQVSDVEELCRILSSADVGIVPDPVNPYSDASTMNKVMEYMFFGLPVVGYDLTENRFSAGEAGTFVAGDQGAGLAKAIDALLDDPRRRAAMGRVGAQRVRDELAWEHSVPALLAAYTQVTAPPGQRGLTAPPQASQPGRSV